MNPQPRDLHVDQLLTNVSIRYSNGMYIADRVFPIVFVTSPSGMIPAFDKSPWFRDAAHLRAPGTRSRGGGWSVSQSAYVTAEYSFRHELDWLTLQAADAPWNLEANGTNFVTDKLQMRREVNLAATMFTTGVWNNDLVGTVDFDQWDDIGASDPLVDLYGYADTMESSTGRGPNTLVMGKQVWNALKWHPVLIDTIKYTQRAVANEQLFIDLIEIPKLLIGRAIYTTDPEGTAEASVTYSRIWGKHVWIGYVTDAPALNEPTAGMTFVWPQVAGAIQYIRRMVDEERRVDIIECNSYFAQHVTAATNGRFLQNVVS